MNILTLDGIKNPDFKAISAGCDMVLMSRNIGKTKELVQQKMSENSKFNQQIETSVKRVIRMKICLGLI